MSASIPLHEALVAHARAAAGVVGGGGSGAGSAHCCCGLVVGSGRFAV